MIIALTVNEGKTILKDLGIKTQRELDNALKSKLKEASKFVDVLIMPDGSLYINTDETFSLNILEMLKPKLKKIQRGSGSTVKTIKLGIELVSEVKNDYRNLVTKTKKMHAIIQSGTSYITEYDDDDDMFFD